MIIKSLPLLIALLFIITDKLSAYCLLATSCTFSEILWPFFFEIIKPAYFYAIVFTPIAVLLLFLRKEIFQAWLRFAFWWLPLSAIVIAITPSTSNSWMPIYSYSKSEVTIFMASLFTIISLGLIAWKQFVSKK